MFAQILPTSFPRYIYYTIHIHLPSLCAYAHFKRGKKIYLRLKSTGPRINSDAYHNIKGIMYTHTLVCTYTIYIHNEIIIIIIMIIINEKPVFFVYDKKKMV